jgi:glutaryl-CoA dehydrogenase
METFWAEWGERIQGAYHEVEKRGKRDLAALSNLPDIISFLKDMDGEDLVLMLDQVRKIKRRKDPKHPPINGDFYETKALLLDKEEQALLEKVHVFVKEVVEPIATEHWMSGEFPFQIVEEFKKLDICGIAMDGYGGKGRSYLLEGMIAEQISRVDVSTCTFFGVHSGLAMGSVYLCGSEEQKQTYLPQMQKFDKIGAFALTEPDVGSAISMGMKTTCRRNGDTWVINGEKKWIGNATFADLIIVWAKDEDDNQIKGFIVDRNTDGMTTEKIEDKMALRIVQNATIRLKDCKVSEEMRLQNANSFRDTAKVLRMTRAGVAWQAVGCARGAYEHTLAYTMERKQFGREIASFQMTQDLLSQMLSQLTAMQCMVARLSQLQDQEQLRDEQASLAKVFCTVGCRQITSMARELMGANGILLSNKVGRFLADSEALYSYEGTKQINSLIVGRSITGHSAFL